MIRLVQMTGVRHGWSFMVSEESYRKYRITINQLGA